MVDLFLVDFIMLVYFVSFLVVRIWVRIEI